METTSTSSGKNNVSFFGRTFNKGQSSLKPKAPEKSLAAKFVEDMSGLAQIPFNLSKLHGFVSKVNIHRLSTRFTLLTLKLSLLSAAEFRLLGSLEWLLGRPLNLAILDYPLGVYNALSVGLFALRFLVDVIDILQHTFNGPKETRMDRFYEGIKKYHYFMVNDLIWGIVNALSNYAAYFRIPPAVPNMLMLGFTVFDIVWLNYALYAENLDYSTKKSEYQGNSVKLEKLERDHEKKKSAFLFYIAAACLMLGAFTAAFLLCPPALLPLCFLVCNVAIGMYLSGDQYGAAKEAELILKQQTEKGFDTVNEQKAVSAAWNDLSFTMAKNIIMPFIIIGAFTVSVPAGILLTVAYIAYENDYFPKLFSGDEPEVEQKPLMMLGC